MSKQGLYEYLKKMVDDGKVKLPEDPGILLVSLRDELQSPDFGFFRFDAGNRRVLGVDPAAQPSRHIESGYAYFIERGPVSQIRFEKLPSGFNDEQYNRLIIEKIARAFMIPEEFFGPYRWERREGESIWFWGIRLANRDLLDDPDVRWEYQKTVIHWPVDLVRGLLHGKE